ncbi:hypothetical protein [Paracoccus laeviglucosivorans]|uniref:Uncharacterized protein n=1 Tax=Paracoccus laeviglucosivorans TaxID=1197861 RepID=A0A521E3K2_9RHOB|nr:hypothetical protein [Paracoccus laeviglucosivorans]SMO78519.1 hypothetical protein SAMN06265221_11129 [Paracoccus laeviglucosivorans]
MGDRWTRVQTFAEIESADDWTVLRNGLVVGRVFKDITQHNRPETWRWSVITIPSANSYAETLEKALEQVRARASDKWGHPPYGWKTLA